VTYSKNCTACGAIVQDGDRFCGECGAKLNEITAEKPAVLGNWFFPATTTTVVFADDGEVIFHFESEPEFEQEAWDARGKWEQIGQRVLIDFNGFTVYDVELRGDRMIGTWFRTSGDDAGVHIWTVLERAGADVSDPVMFPHPALEDRHDDSYDSLLFRGFKCYFLTDDDVDEMNRAKMLFEQAVRIDPQRPEAYVGLGAWAYFMDEFEAGLTYIDDALDKNFGLDARYELIRFEHVPDGGDPEDPDLYEIDIEWVILVRADMHYQLDHMDLAERDIADVLSNLSEDEDNAATAYRLKALLCYERDSLDEALLHIEKAESIDPSDSDCPYIAGLVLLEKQDMNRAIEKFTSALSLDPSNADALIKRASTFSAIGAKKQMRKDVEALQDLIERGYGDAEIRQELDDLLSTLH